jgi:prepilin-type N-terminal cleavage/methylation domain-containing protein
MTSRTAVFRRARGFTIVELLVSIVVAGVALVGIYFYYSTVQHAMREQARISQAQLNARLGLELIASDIQRAGYLATPNSRRDPSICVNSAVHLQPVVFRNGAAGRVYAQGDLTDPSQAIPNPAANVNINPDDVKLFGDYLNASEYLAETIDPATSTVKLQPMLRYEDPVEADGFGGSAIATMTDQEFAMLFPNTGLLRVVNRHGFGQFVRITGTTGFAQRTVRVTPAPIRYGPLEPCGVEGFCEGCRVNVVNGVWYRIEVDPGDPLKTDLVRYYLDQAQQPILATREVVVEYAVDLQLWFRAAVAAGAGAVPFVVNTVEDVPADNLVMVGGAGVVPDGTGAARPESLRSAVVRLTVRTRLEDSKFFFAQVQRTNPATRIRGFDIAPGAPGAAHVRTYTTEVELPNIALRNLW